MGDLKEFEALKRDVVALEEDAGALARTLGKRGKDKLEGTRMRVWNATKDIEKRAQEGLRDAYETVRKESERQLKLARKGIGLRPISSVSGALLTGLILGAVLGFLLGQRD